MATELRERLQSTLGDAYSLERELGGGGMSRVFVARETSLGRQVVVKVLPPDLAAGVNAGRFKREIQVAARLQHPHIVPVLAAGETEGVLYYTMPYVEGESLRTRIARGGALSLTEVVGILRDVAKALAYAHEHGVVHRDIKPDNVMLSGGSAVVADFGIAKAVSASLTEEASATRGTTLTQIGTALGTPMYMAPEQAAADPKADWRVDLYAFGCMAYELLAGRPPFHGLTPQNLLAAQMGERPQPVQELRVDTPPLLAELVMRCLEKEAHARPQFAADLVRVLDSVTSGRPLRAMPPILLGGRGMLRNALLLYAVAFVAVAVVAKAAIVAVGLPDWVFPGALVVMALGLPAILFTGYVHHATPRALTATRVLTPGGAAVSRSTLATLALKASPHVSWHRTATGGFVALGVFALLVAGFMASRALGIGPAGSLLAAGSLSERDRILVADFRSPGADSALGTVVAEAVRTNLAQSRAVRVVPASAIADGLRRMQRPSASHLGLALARDLAEREGIKAVVHGDVTAAGQGFILTLRLVSAATGDELASFREAAKDATGLIPAIDRATRDLRGKIGESLKAVRAAPPLMRVTTASLPALRKYTEGMTLHYRDNDYVRAAAAFEEAIRLDSAFAMAYTRAGTSYRNAAVRPARQDSLRLLAFEKRERLPDLERALVEGAYYVTIARRDSAIAAMERAAAIDPSQSPIWNDLGISYNGRREYARAESAYRRAIALEDGNSQPWGNITSALVNQGKFGEARRAIADARSRFPQRSAGLAATLLSSGAAIALNEGRYDSAVALLDSAGRLPRQIVSRTAQGRLASFYTARGRLRESMQLRIDLLDRDRSSGGLRRLGAAAAIGLALDSVEVDLWIRERAPGEAVRRLDALLVRFPRTVGEGPAPDELLRSAVLYAKAGRPDRARAALARYDRDVRDSTQLRAQVPFLFVRAYQVVLSRRIAAGEIALAERRFADAIAEFRASDLAHDGRPHGCATCTDVLLGRAFDLADMRDSAVAALERYVTKPWSDRWGVDAFYLAGAHKRLGELYEARDDRTRAAEHYAKFVELWKDADPELQPKVAEVRRRLVRLRAAEAR
jgi:tetratricopeptide (TPR) repeat protein/tRNA A-37 threonylcarbamoyl transferase component Bud32